MKEKWDGALPETVDSVVKDADVSTCVSLCSPSLSSCLRLSLSAPAPVALYPSLRLSHRSGAGWRGVRLSPGERRLRADGRVLPRLQEEVQQTLLLGETAPRRGRPGASPSGEEPPF